MLTLYIVLCSKDNILHVDALRILKTPKIQLAHDSRLWLVLVNKAIPKLYAS